MTFRTHDFRLKFYKRGKTGVRPPIRGHAHLTLDESWDIILRAMERDRARLAARRTAK